MTGNYYHRTILIDTQATSEIVECFALLLEYVLQKTRMPKGGKMLPFLKLEEILAFKVMNALFYLWALVT